jgi:K+/H+ antiporter YhaU regulatory subunit KhtT
VITAVTTLIISFARTDREGALLRILVLVGGLVALLFLARSATFDRLLQRLIARVLARYTDLDVRDYAALLHISGEYAVAELLVEPGDWVAERRLDELDLPEEGLRVLGIEQSGGVYLGAPDGDTTIRPGDTLILYGRADAVAEIDRRKAGPTGDAEHLDAVEEERELVED